jgi:excinuclease ABC subunit A
MIKYTDDQIINLIFEKFINKNITVLSPIIKARKGHYRDLFEKIRKQGFLKVRTDGTIKELSFGLQLDRYKIHDIEIVVDKINVSENSKQRIIKSVKTAMKYSENKIAVMDETGNVQYFSRSLMCPTSGISYEEPEPNIFSFNTPYGACPKCNGLGVISELDIDKIIPDKTKTIKNGAIIPVGKFKNNWIFKQLEAIGKKYNFDINTPVKDISEKAINVILYGSDEIFTVINDSIGITYNLNFEGIINFISEQYTETSSNSIKKWVGKFMNTKTCPECNGTRLKKESLSFKISAQNIADLANLELIQLYKWFDNIDSYIDKRRLKIAQEIVREIKTKIKFLLDVGLDYLTLNRTARSLSGGESQRIRLATQISSQLTGILYILDEPSIGLHQRDSIRLIKTLKKLRDMGNSIIVAEHDREIIMSADYIIDIGPKQGKYGGEIIANGTTKDFIKSNTLTAQYLKGEKYIKIPLVRRKGNGKFLILNNAKGNNLKNVCLKLPLGMLICVTGVSGSGKSSLVNETLYPVLSQYFYKSFKNPLPYNSIENINNIDKVIEINQAPIGKTPRSNPATYTGVFDEIRKLYAHLPESKIRGYKSGRFSFNVKGGRCETCQGAGLRTIKMNFLPDVYVVCETCNGKRYNRETLEIKYKGKSISDVLNMSINQCVPFFKNIPNIYRKVKTMQHVGLGYITLGQQSTTLSGGEAQRVKLSAELEKRDTGNTLYILDEPTIGLHFDDVKVLLNVLNILVDKGNTVLIIEHNMDVIKSADYIIDIGPECGEKGGKIICQGPPEKIIDNTGSYTAKYLKNMIITQVER